MTRIALIGNGAIARHVMAEAATRGWDVAAQLVRPEKAQGTGQVGAVADLPEGLDMVVDCAGHTALAQLGPEILRSGRDLLTVSLGALADQSVAQDLRHAAEAAGTRLHLASGAIGALDCLRAARTGKMARVVYTGRKPPEGWRGSPAEEALDLGALQGPTVHFAGAAREAALHYPKNANVAAAVALAGIGFERTEVQLIADPAAGANIHDIHAEGAFGSFHVTVSGASLPDNPRSSALAAMSVVAALAEPDAPIGF